MEANPDMEHDDVLRCDNKTFEPFPRLPFEIQYRIWEMSLPGPRALCVKQTSLKTMLFLAKHATPNPAALSTCHKSRSVALKRYRLVFGSSSVYADLEGGDMLYYGPWNKILAIPVIVAESRKNPPYGQLKRIPKQIRADMEKVTHVVLHFDDIPKVTEHYYLQNSGRYRLLIASMFALELAAFPNLKHISLSLYGNDRATHTKPGYVVINTSQPQLPVLVETDTVSITWGDLVEPEFRDWTPFLDQEQVQIKLPAVQVVKVDRIMDLGHMFYKTDLGPTTANDRIKTRYKGQ